MKHFYETEEEFLTTKINNFILAINQDMIDENLVFGFFPAFTQVLEQQICRRRRIPENISNN